jgi:hypothetical protein
MERRRCAGCDKRRAAMMAKLRRSRGTVRSTGGAYLRGNAAEHLSKDKTTEKETK